MLGIPYLLDFRQDVQFTSDFSRVNSQHNSNLFLNYSAEYKLVPIYFSLIASKGIGNICKVCKDSFISPNPLSNNSGFVSTDSGKKSCCRAF